MDVIDVDSSDSDVYVVDGFSRQRPTPTSRPRQQRPQQRRSVPMPILEPLPRRLQPRQQPRQSSPPQRSTNREYPVIANITISDEEDGEIIEDDHQNNDANPAVNGNLNSDQNENQFELDVLPLEMLQIKKEELELQLKREIVASEQEPPTDLEPVSDSEGNEFKAPNPISQAQLNELVEPSLEDVSDNDLESSSFSESSQNELRKSLTPKNKITIAKSVESPRSFNTTNRTPISIKSFVEKAGCSSSRSEFLSNKTMKSPVSQRAQKSTNANDRQQIITPNQTPRPAAPNTSNRVQIPPNQSAQSFDTSLDNVSDADDFEMDTTPSNQPRSELIKPLGSNTTASASNSNEKRVVFTAGRLPGRIPSWTNQTVQSPISSSANQTPRSDASIQSPNSLLNQPQFSPNQRAQSFTPNVSARSPHSFTANRSQFSPKETTKSTESSREKKSPAQQSFVPYQYPNTLKSPSVFSSDWNGANFSANHTAEWYRSFGIVMSPNIDAVANETAQPSTPAQIPQPFKPIEAATHDTPYVTPNRVHSHRTEPSPIANQRSPIYAPLDVISNDMLSLNVDHFAQQKTPARQRSPQTPESGIAASEQSEESDYELDLYRSNGPTNPQLQRSHGSNIESTDTQSSLNANSQVSHERHSNDSNGCSSESNQLAQIRNLDDIDDVVKNAIKGVVDKVKKRVSKKRKSLSPITCESSSSNTGDDLLQPLTKRPAIDHHASHGGASSNSPQERSESETETTSTDDVDDGDTDPSYEPNTEEMDDDNGADENDDYDSDCSRDTVPFDYHSRKPVKSERKYENDESSVDSEETIIDLNPYFPPNQRNLPENVDDEAVDADTELLVPVPVPVPVHVPRPSTSGVHSKRNTDKTLYLCSAKAKYCPLCRKRYARMVNHMKTQHPNSEVFVSRISPRMVDFIAPENENERKFIKYVKHAELLHAMCIFCEEEKSFSPHYWIDHVRSHTGEYGNACEICGKICSFSSHCNVPTTKIDNFNLRDEHMIAYRCKECNYVQTIPENIRRHLANQHDLYDEDERNFQVFTLLPAYRTLPKQNNPHEQPHIQGAIQASSVPYGPSLLDLLNQPQKQFNENLGVQAEQQPQSSGRFEILESVVLRPATQTSSALPQPVAPIRTEPPQPSTSNSISKIKTDPEAVEILLVTHSALKSFKAQNASKMISVRPYIDGDYAKKLDINVISQFALFKCMHDPCLFACDSEDIWKIHMEQHSNLIDILNEKSKLQPDYKNELLKFCECPYCGYEPKRNKNIKCRSLDAVCRHMEMEHLRNIIQCKHCYYRTNEIDNIIFHMERYHSGCDREILLYGVRRDFQDNDLEELKQCDQNITRIKCNLLDHGSKEKCTKEFACFNTLRSHQIVVHSVNRYKCSCHTQFEMKTSEIQAHFVEAHPDLHCEEFQCLHCEEGFEEIAKIREHMFENHPSKFLWIGARRRVQENPQRNDDDDTIQFVYIGDSKDYSTYKLFTCANRDALNSMDPMQLNPYKMCISRSIKSKQFPNIKAEFSGLLPPISMTENHKKEIDFITYEQYQQKSLKNRKKSSKHDKSIKDKKKSSRCESKPLKMVDQNIRMETIPRAPSSSKTMKTMPTPASDSAHRKRSPDAIPSTSKHRQNSSSTVVRAESASIPAQALAHSAPTTSTQFSTEYFCITNKIYENLSNELRYQSRLCCECVVFFKIENETHFQKYMMHLKAKHACEHAEEMRSAKALFDHRMKYHRNQPITALKIEKCNDDDPQKQLLVQSIIHARFQCQLCDSRFDSIKKIDSHNAEHHRGIFVTQRIGIVFESLVVKSTDLNQPTYSKSESVPLTLASMFKCDRCQPGPTFRLISAAIEHHNQCHSSDAFEISIRKFAFDIAPADTDMGYSVHREYLFKCLHCDFYFTSLENFEVHDKCNGHNREPQFQLEKLVKCSQDSLIGTFKHVKRHSMEKHAGKAFTPVNVFHLNQCGLCTYRYEDSIELARHFNLMHSGILSDPITNDVLESLELKEVSVGECHYRTGCCIEFKHMSIDQILNHISICNRRFKCIQCPTMPKQANLTKFIEHCQQSHAQTNREIFAKLHNLKTFLALLSDMHVIFPNGLHVIVDKIADTDFHQMKLMPCITQKIMDIFQREASYQTHQRD